MPLSSIWVGLLWDSLRGVAGEALKYRIDGHRNAWGHLGYVQTSLANERGLGGLLKGTTSSKCNNTRAVVVLSFGKL